MDIPNLIQSLYQRGHLVEPDAVKFISNNSKKIITYLDGLDPSSTPVITLTHLQKIIEQEKGDVVLLSNYDENFDIKGGVQDFHSYFTSRYQKISNLLRGRPELEGVTSIRNSTSSRMDKISLIGMVTNVSETKSGHYMLELEDQTGKVKVVLPKGSEGHKLGGEIVYEEVVCVSGRSGRDVVFARNVTFPGVPQISWPEQNFSVALISDTHVGSKMFMEDVFINFISWLNGEGPEEQRKLAKSVKYLLVAGDLVDGCGVYKGQEKELNLPDIKEQYAHFAELISKIRNDIKIIISPGNHDATREAEPQPTIPMMFAQPLYEMSNVVMVSSPSLVKLGGLVVLIYHGSSLDSVINSIPNLRKTGYDEPHKAMMTLLNKRHLNPIYGEATRIFSETDDSLVIKKIPHLLHMGHVHSIGACTHRGVRIVNSGTFQSQTPFQAKIGHHPKPGIVPIIEGSGKITMINFNTNN
jgi:DNA polymerase II small subunit